MLLLWAVGVFVLSSLPGPALPQIESAFPLDKIAHFGLYAIGGLLLGSLLLRATRWHAAIVLLAGVVALALFGLLDEWYQQLTPGRTGADPLDWVADLAGALTGLIATNRIHGQRRSPAEDREAPARDRTP